MSTINGVFVAGSCAANAGPCQDTGIPLIVLAAILAVVIALIVRLNRSVHW